MNKTKVLAVTWAAMAAVDSYMSYPVMAYYGTKAEQNPVARYLIAHHGLNIFLFLGGIAIAIALGIVCSRIRDRKWILAILTILVISEIWGLRFTIPDFLGFPSAWWDIRGWM